MTQGFALGLRSVHYHLLSSAFPDVSVTLRGASDCDYTESSYAMRRTRCCTLYVSQLVLAPCAIFSCSLGDEEVQRQAEGMFRETC